MIFYSIPNMEKVQELGKYSKIKQESIGNQIKIYKIINQEFCSKKELDLDLEHQLVKDMKKLISMIKITLYS